MKYAILETNDVGVTWYHVTKFRKAGLLLVDTAAINKMENSSANSHNGVSKHHQKRGIHAVLAEVQATVTGDHGNFDYNTCTVHGTSCDVMPAI